MFLISSIGALLSPKAPYKYYLQSFDIDLLGPLHDQSLRPYWVLEIQISARYLMSRLLTNQMYDWVKQRFSIMYLWSTMDNFSRAPRTHWRLSTASMVSTRKCKGGCARNLRTFHGYSWDILPQLTPIPRHRRPWCICSTRRSFSRSFGETPWYLPSNEWC
jgi:hypothetical protein